MYLRFIVKKEKEKNANTDPSFVSQFIISAFPIDFPTFALYVVAKKKEKKYIDSMLLSYLQCLTCITEQL